MGVALLFIDGVGIGRRDPSINPLARTPFVLSQFMDGGGEPLPGDGRLTPLDCTFGVAGRPQSATNQTAMLTGEPAPRLIGEHILGFPNAPLRELLARRSIVKRLRQAGGAAEFANCYPAGYLDALGLLRRPSAQPDVAIPPRAVRRLRPSATTLAMAAGGVPLRTLDDARAHQGLTNDIDGASANARGFRVPRRTADEAAAVFWGLAEGTDFLLFEHYLADEAGHAQDHEAAHATLTTFDHFARSVIARRPPGWEVLICSDHGNVEDLSSRRHTLHPVPLLSFGVPASSLERVKTVADVGTLILERLHVEEPLR